MSEQPQSHRHRAEQDEPFHDEPSSPAAEHVAASSDLQAIRFRVKLVAHGEATVEVEAEDEAGAEEKAFDTVPGFIVEGGGVAWDIASIEEL